MVPRRAPGRRGARAGGAAAVDGRWRRRGDHAGRTGDWRDAKGRRGDARQLAAGRFDLAVLLPNSFHAGWLVRQAGVPERWGYRGDLRDDAPHARGRQAARSGDAGRVLPGARPDARRTGRADDRSASGHRRPARVRRGAAPRQRLDRRPPGGLCARRRLRSRQALAAGTRRAGGTQPCRRPWRDARFWSARGATSARSPRCSRATATWQGRAAEAIDLGGRTDLPTLAGVFALCNAVVSNDSGAMHLAAAVGVPVTAIFGPTNEQATSPLPHPSGRVAAVVVGPGAVPAVPAAVLPD